MTTRVPLSRAMVLRQPWAQAVVEGAFPALLRSVRTNIQERVGVLAASSPDPAGFRAKDAYPPRGAIVGAVRLEGCIEIEGSARSFLADAYGKEFAGFYPEHFIPDEENVYVWVLSEAVPAETPREWEEKIPQTWARCSTWIEGEVMPLMRPALATM